MGKSRSEQWIDFQLAQGGRSEDDQRASAGMQSAFLSISKVIEEMSYLRSL